MIFINIEHFIFAKSPTLLWTCSFSHSPCFPEWLHYPPRLFSSHLSGLTEFPHLPKCSRLTTATRMFTGFFFCLMKFLLSFTITCLPLATLPEVCKADLPISLPSQRLCGFTFSSPCGFSVLSQVGWGEVKALTALRHNQRLLISLWCFG